MQRIAPMEFDAAPEKSKPILEQIKKAFGAVPNIFATMAHSPATLKSVMSLVGDLSQGELAGIAHEAIGLRISELNGCEYCTAAHTQLAIKAGATEEDTLQYRQGISPDPKLQAMLSITSAMVETKGKVCDQAIAEAKAVGVTDSMLCEIVAIIALFTLTNYFNELVQTELDFPAVKSLSQQ